MKTINYWEQFLSTGKIDDYLAYRGKGTYAHSETGPGEDEESGRSAGTGTGYRDHFKNGTHRGV